MKKFSIFCLILLFLGLHSIGQRIDFRTHITTDQITATIVENPQGLNFNSVQPLIPIGQSSPVTINLLDPATVVIEIDAPLDYDLSIEFITTGTLSLIGNPSTVTLPFQMQFAYNNTGELFDAQRRAVATVVPFGFSTLTIPLRRRTEGAPLPPPVPDHENYVRPRGKAYLYIYGILGPIPGNADAGQYSGSIDITINYADTAN